MYLTLSYQAGQKFIALAQATVTLFVFLTGTTEAGSLRPILRSPAGG